MREAAAIAVMAKAPRPGFCKTRLIPPLSPAAAAALHAAFLADITANLARAGAGVVPHVAYAPAGAAAEMARHVAPGTRLLLADGRVPAPAGVAGFGRCLWHAVAALLEEGYGAAGVLNADSPTLPAAYLAQAAAWLAEDPAGAVLGPAEDGGYYFLGMGRRHGMLFADIAWSTDAVADQTRARAAAAGVRLRELPVWYDVDDAAALARLHAELTDGARAPATAAWFAALEPERAAMVPRAMTEAADAG